jgi:hypothetical protein
MKRKFIIVLILATLMIATSLTACVQAAPKETVTRRQIGTTGLWYTQTTIVLGGALDAIKIPDSWNGKLVMLCRGGLSVDLNAIPMDLYTVFLKK